MPIDVTRNEFDQLKTRVEIVEVEGEKMVTRHILEQSRRNGDDLAAIKSRLDRHDQRFDNLERRVDGLERHVKQDLPTIIRDVMREVLDEHDKSR